MARVSETRRAREPFGEKDFYLEEFRGRSVLIAFAPACVAGGPDLRPLAAAVCDLVRNGTRVLLWWPAATRAVERRLLTALAGVARRRDPGRIDVPRVRVDATAPSGSAVEALLSRLWVALRRERLCVLLVGGPITFPRPASLLAARLRIPKLVLVDDHGGLEAGEGTRLSFVDENVLETLLRQGEAEWSGFGERRVLLAAVREALWGGVESVNLCTPQGIGDELFTYVGSGTLFTQGDYCHVEPLGLDDFARAERLLERGRREGLLKPRSPEEMAELLTVGFGATICGRHLAGVAGLLAAPYAAERAAEIVGLYTITRFKGEGIGERLVGRLLAEADRRGYVYVFACAIDDRAQQFFTRLGFERVGGDDVPARKWVGYDPRRRARVAVFRHRLATAATAAEA
jgi:amino-acid N-acetyltransferase